ncbi:MAG: hypothetical protein ACREQY_23280 [Candidatus Binatia bacterium]
MPSGHIRMVTRGITGLVVLLFVGIGFASEVPMPDVAGHPKNAFPLSIHGDVAGEEDEAVLRKAVADWNRLAADALGVKAGPRHSPVGS